jgi:VanZ family protein
MPQLFDNQDKIEHLLAYCGLALLLSLTLHIQKKFIYLSSKAFLFTLIFILAYAAVDELHQMLIPGRYCDFYDWLADSIGGSLGIIIIFLFIRNSTLQNQGEAEA